MQMNKSIINIILKFLNLSEDFLHKSIFCIDLDDKDNSYYFKNNSKNLDQSIFFNPKEKNINTFDLNKKYFDFIFVYNKNHDLNHKSLKKAFLHLKKYCKRGTKLFVLIRNNRNLKSYLINNLLIRKSFLIKTNIYCHSSYLVYDYFYYFYPKRLYNKRTNIFIEFIYEIVNFIDLQRFKFFSSNLIIKYIYVP